MTYPQDDYTSENLLDFTMTGNPIEEDEVWRSFDTSWPGYQFPPDTNTFMFMAASGTYPGKESRMLVYFDLDPESENEEVKLSNDSTVMKIEVDLASVRQIPVRAGMADLSIEWNQMTVNAIGNEYEGSQINEAVAAHYEDLTLKNIEDDFLNLEELADGWWTGEVISGTHIDLSTLRVDPEDEESESFPGIDDEGVWLVALYCTVNCNNPAPWSITVLHPCS